MKPSSRELLEQSTAQILYEERNQWHVRLYSAPSKYPSVHPSRTSNSPKISGHSLIETMPSASESITGSPILAEETAKTYTRRLIFKSDRTSRKQSRSFRSYGKI